MKKTILAAVMLFGALTMSAQSYEHSLGVSVGNLFGVSYKGFFFGVEGLGMQIDLGCKLSNWGTHYSVNFKYEETIMGKTESRSETETHPTDMEKEMKDANLSMNYFTFEVNPNIVYNLPVHSGSYGSLAFCAGGGISLGMMKSGSADSKAYGGKGFWWAMSHTQEGADGKEAIIKPAFKFGINALVGLELDLNAAPIVIGFDFRPGYGMGYLKTSNEVMKESAITNFFDWTLAAAVRYKF
ncbi:MAG: hypothetical protein IJR74_05110 [Paludibacteraceae bacterium]|nr:hypothetical protein [Paludibacteraceae bacterium]